MNKTKQCRLCGDVKPLNKFCKSKSCKDGHTHQCMECKRKTPSSIRYNQKRVYRYKPYNISLEDYTTLLNQQEGKCKICGKHESEFKKKLSVDHDHKTGRVRGLLCTRCNNGIGLLKENIDIFKSAINYLQK